MSKTKGINKKVLALASITFIILLSVITGAVSSRLRVDASPLDYFEMSNLDERTDGYFMLVDRESGEVVMRTARIIHVGDEYIDQRNRLFRVVRIDGDTAYASYIEDITLAGEAVQTSISRERERGFMPVQQGNRGWIGIYHSHGAESYVPTDGTESIPEGGGVIVVGEVFAQSLEKQGIQAEHSQNPHVPHDAGAYHRSRRTVEEFLKENPNALFDIHRDAVPPEEYARSVNGTPVTQLQFVVGQQNQNVANNRQFAEGLKKVADERYPGLVKGIFMANGNYNQDLAPRILLVEVGTHKNRREEAENAVVFFADVVNAYLYGGDGAGVKGNIMARESSTSALTTVAVVLIVLTGIGFFLLVSTGNWEEFKTKVNAFYHKEFNDLRGRTARTRIGRHKGDEGDNN